ncbi:OsmC family protein [Fodinibius sp.]|uniref:OsmC family protein n=1 Tax=Fodinibius sp. TaxID=1872440 RepID=UPI002ACE2763|nr:OsmC family protein [Fodinibius sp.]MDZ7659903.1 OsmC family protein [Fodinibius sp.]
MDKSELRAAQSPLKEKYKTNPEEAEWVLTAEGRVGDGIACYVSTDAGEVEAGLHPATGGDGSQACSGDMLLEALVACAGVTLKSVATAMEIDIEEGTVKAEGVLDFKGTLAVSKEAPVGFKSITLHFDLTTDADEKKVEKLIELTERYCVIYQTLKNSPMLKTDIKI